MTVSPDETLITKGIKSTVYEYDEAGRGAGKFGRYGVGHIGLFDLDDHLPISEIKPTFERVGIGGPTVVLESSPGNYHAWNLTIRDFGETADLLEQGGDDTGHNNVGKKRGWWRLRVGPKLTENSDVYKDLPEYKTAFHIPFRKGERTVSGSHIEVLKRTHEHFDGWSDDRYHYRGNLVETVNYTTFTDEGKALQRQVSKGSLDPGEQ